MVQFNVTAREKINRIVVGLITGLKVSSKSKPGICVYPCATRRALYLSMDPSSLNLVRYTHFDPTMFVFTGLGTKLHVLFCWRASSSSNIAVRQ